MRWCAAELLHDVIYDYHDFTFQDAYEYANPNRTEWIDGSLLEDFGMMRIDTSRDHIGIKPVRRGGSPGFMGLGINATAQLAMESLTNQRLSSLKLDRDILPKEGIFGDMLDEFQPGRWPSRKYSLRFPTEPSRQELEDIILFDISPPHPEEYLQTLLGNNAHLASGRGVDAERYFQALLFSGATLGIVQDSGCVQSCTGPANRPRRTAGGTPSTGFTRRSNRKRMARVLRDRRRRTNEIAGLDTATEP